jgi:DNA invertase Pin-like site-specific DNA recombinase
MKTQNKELVDKIVINSNMSAEDNFRLDMQLSLSKYHSDTISRNIKRSLETKRQNGQWTNKAPFGYINVKDKDGKSTVIVDAKNKELIKMIFKLHDKEVSISDIHKKLREVYPNDSFETKRRLNNAFIYRVIRNKDFYSGSFTCDGKKYSHKYERILTIKK